MRAILDKVQLLELRSAWLYPMMGEGSFGVRLTKNTGQPTGDENDSATLTRDQEERCRNENGRAARVMVRHSNAGNVVRVSVHSDYCLGN